MTTQIKSLNKKSVSRIHEEMQKVMDVLGKELGVDIHIGGCRYSQKVIIFKQGAVTVSIIENGKVVEPMIEAFKKYAYRYELKPDDLGQKVTIKNVVYKIVGAKPRNWKRPIILEDVSNQRRYKFTAREVRNSFSFTISV